MNERQRTDAEVSSWRTKAGHYKAERDEARDARDLLTDIIDEVAGEGYRGDPQGGFRSIVQERDDLVLQLAVTVGALRLHHEWHLSQGTMTIEGFDLDMAAEYSDSSLYEKTTAALASLPESAKALREVVEAERAACAEVARAFPAPNSTSLGAEAAFAIAAAIEARSKGEG